MAPVIRISDDAFRRLQHFSEPLVDTPSSVIERVLDHYEATHMPGSEAISRAAPKPMPRVVERPSDQVDHLTPSFNLFLVPTTRENLRASIQKAIPIQVARECLPDSQFESLTSVLAPAKEFRCWATNDSNKAVFSQMNPGDVVLLTQKGTGKFNHRARVLTKLHSEPLGQRIWPVGSGLPWEYIYVLDDLRPFDIRKDRLITALGYDPTFWVPGHIRVSPEKLRNAIGKYGTFERLLDACRS